MYLFLRVAIIAVIILLIVFIIWGIKNNSNKNS
jgi:hypothetical protein